LPPAGVEDAEVADLSTSGAGFSSSNWPSWAGVSRIPVLVFSGGEPLCRGDLFDLVSGPPARAHIWHSVEH
jgi:hypothetical protein